MKAEITKRFPSCQIELIEGSGGVFEVKKEGQLLFSKKKAGRFPDPQEILGQLQS